MQTVCGIDLGTQSCKLIVYDYEKKSIIAQSSAPVEIIAQNDGTREQKTEWYDAVLKICFDKIDKRIKKTIAAIGVSGQQHGFVPLDEKGKPVYNVKLWCDTSTSKECGELTKAAGGEKKLIAKTGLPMRPGYTAPKVLWLKKNKSAAFKNLRHILLPHNYINFLLTGEYWAEYGDASGTALFDVRQRNWSSEICKLISPDVEKYLPALTTSEKTAGVVSKAAADLYGINEGTIVSSGGGDNMMSAIGTGAVRDGFLTMSLGTSGTLFGFSKTPVIDEAGDLAAFCSSSSGAGAAGWLPLLCTMNCTVASEEFRNLLGYDVKTFDKEASKAPIGADGIAILPFFNGERTPNLPNGRASVNGITTANFKKENLARAALESAIFGMRIGLDGFIKLGFKPKEIRLTGGGSRSVIWQSIAANVMNVPVRILNGTEAAAMGAAIQALWCFESKEQETKPPAHGKKTSIEDLADKHVLLGATVKPDSKNVKMYNDAYAVYSKYLGALNPLYK